MTLLAGVGTKIGGFVAQRAVQVAAAGILSGAVGGGAIVATGLSPLDEPRTAATLAILACPGSGPELARIPSGQTLLVTGRSVDGHWLEVYVGAPGIERGWAQASALRLQSAADGLPIGSCVVQASDQPVAVAPGPSPSPEPAPSVPATVGPSPTPPPTLAPGQTATPTPRSTPTPRASSSPAVTPHITPKPTSKPTPTPTPTPTPSPTPTPTPDHPPVISNLSESINCIDNGPTYTQSVISVTATDPDPGDTLTVRMRIGNIDQYGNQYYRLGSLTMTHVSGSLYQYTLTQAQFQSYGWSSWTTDREVTYDVTARDSSGADSATLLSHSSISTQLWYRVISTCTVV